MAYPAPVEALVEALEALPGIGRVSAERLTFHVLRDIAAGEERGDFRFQRGVAAMTADRGPDIILRMSFKGLGQGPHAVLLLRTGQVEVAPGTGDQ